MKLSIFATLLILCLLGQTSSKRHKKSLSALHFTVVSKTLSASETIVRELYDVWQDLLREPDIGIKKALLRNRNRKVVGQLILINSKLNAIEQSVQAMSEGTIVNLVRAFSKIIRQELKLQDLSAIVSQINFAEEMLQAYLIHGFQNLTNEETELELMSDISMPSLENNAYLTVETHRSKNDSHKFSSDGWLLEKHTLQDFAEWATSHDYNSIKALLSRLHILVVPKQTDSSGIFEVISSSTKELQTNICDLGQSPNQILYNLYNTLALTELKGLTLLQFSYMLLKMYNKGNFTVEAEISRSKYEERSKQKLEVARNALLEADRSMYRCDPKQYVEGVTHTKLTKLMQGYIENEVNLNPYGTCRENCQYYTYTEYNGCYKSQFCSHQSQCKGKVVDCRYVDSDMNICRSTNKDRRYDWVEYENGRVLGTKGACRKNDLFKVDSWWRYLFWHCSYCLCFCDDHSYDSDRYFNLRSVTSDIKENKIVTGIRMIKKNQVVHMQIQQGVLIPRGLVNKTSLSWKPIEEYSVKDTNYKNGVDYHTMNWLERSIDMDEVYAPPEHVVTGLRFRKIGTHLNLEVRVTPINFTTGQVFDEGYSYWMGNDNTDGSLTNPRREIMLTEPDIPTRNGPHTLNSKHDMFIKFQATSFETDAGQTTVPFLDSQALTSKGFPLSGVGLIHRGKVRSGGFIAPKIISYDFVPHLKISQTT